MHIESPVNYKNTFCKIMTEINSTSNEKYSYEHLRMWLPYPNLSYSDVEQLLSNKVASSKRGSEFPGYLLTEDNIHNLIKSSCNIVAETRLEGEAFDLEEPHVCAKCHLKLTDLRYCCKCFAKVYCSTECRDTAAHCGLACKFCNGLSSKRIKCACGEVMWCDATCSAKGQKIHKCTPSRPSSTYKLIKTPSSRSEAKLTGRSSSPAYHKPISKDRFSSYGTSLSLNSSEPTVTPVQPKSAISSKTYSYGTSLSFKSQESPRYSSSPSRRTPVGLKNLGNTCYMNSTLQCLVHSKPFSEYFLQSFTVDHINTGNKLSSRGKLTLAYVRLLREITSGHLPISPYEFKTELGQLVSQFDGYEQHDASELLECLLDAVHEDLNRVTNKVYISSPPSHAFLPDKFRSKVAWKEYTARNASIVTDLFGGQYRSEVTCTQCGKVSVTFDPYLTLHLNIPCDVRQELDITVVFANPDQIAVKLKLLTSNHASIDSIKREVAEAVNKDPVTLSPCIVVNNTIIDRKATPEEGRKGTLYFYEYTVTPFLDVWVNISKTFPVRPGSQLGDSHPRHMLIAQEATLKDLHHVVYKYLKRCVDHCTADYEFSIDSADDDASLLQNFKLAFPSLVGQPGNDLYTLRTVNLNKGIRPCDYCNEKFCRGCPLPYDDTCVQDKFGETPVCLDALFVLSNSWLAALRQTLDHPSVFEVAQRLSHENQRNLSLYECFEYTGRPEHLDEENTAYCSQCRDQVQIIKKIEVWSVPKLLIIVLKRFKQQGVLTSKINKVIDFPIEGLNLSKYVLSETAGLYDLYAVSNHIGSLGYGHYTAYAKHDGSWYEFDDSRVSLLSRGLEPSGAAYVLCYQRREV